jgi:glycine/D-amino acid oxidase-like deaminating enzyme
MLYFNELSFWERSQYIDSIDFLVVGAGIVGLSTSLFLRKKFPTAKIVVVEKGYLPTGASTKNAGFACFGSPTEIFDDLKNINENKVWETFLARYEGLNTLFSLVSKDKIDYINCSSWDLIKENESPLTIDFIQYLNEKTKEIIGNGNVYLEDKLSISNFGFSGLRTCYKNNLEGSIDTGKLIQELYKSVISNDIHVLFGIDVKSYESEGNNLRIETNFGDLKSVNLVVCTNGFARHFLDLDVYPARAQVLVTKPIDNLKVKGTFHYDAGYYYFRNIGNRILIGGGRNLDFEGETTTQFETTALIQNSIQDLLRNVILPETQFEVDYSWSGIMGVGSNKTPIIKKMNNNVAFGVRMGGMGVAIGSEVGKKLANLF